MWKNQHISTLHMVNVLAKILEMIVFLGATNLRRYFQLHCVDLCFKYGMLSSDTARI